MDDASKTREELLLEVRELRRQLGAARMVHEAGEEEGPAGQLGLSDTPEAESAKLKTRGACGPELTARPEAPIKILLIEDDPGDVRLIREMLADAGAHDIALEWVPRLSQGLEYLAKGETDLVLLDLSLPDSRGLETFCKAYIRAPEIPFVLLTGLDDETLALTAVQKGAQDYLVKGKTDASRLLRAIHYADERKKLEKALQQARNELERRVEERTTELVAANQQLQEEVAKRRQTEAEQQRLLTEVKSCSEGLRISSEELRIRGEELQSRNETLQRQAEELEDLARELQTGRDLQQAVLEQMPAGVIIAEPSGRIILTNRQAEAIWGQLPGALRDLEKFREIQRFYPDGRTFSPENIPLGRALTLGETVVDEEYLLKRQDGGHLQAVHLNVSATPVRDQQGSIIAAVATYTDLTARKQALADLQQSEERYRSLVELSPEAIVVHARGKIVFVNPAAVQLFGATMRSDLVGQPIMDRMHPDHYDAIQDRIRTVRSGGMIAPVEEKVLRLDGEAVEVETVSSGIMYQGRPAVQVVFRDITERNRVREDLRVATAKLQALIQASPLGIIHLDRNGKIESCNPAIERMFGWRATELIGRFLPIVSRDKWKEAREIILRVFQGEMLTGLELRGRRKDGTWIDVSLAIAPIYDGDGQVASIVALAEDITARKEAEAGLAQSRAEFEAIFNSISDAIIFADPQRRIVLANPAVKPVFGYDPEELIGQSVERLYISRSDFEATRERYFPLTGQVEPSLFEISYRRKNGTLFRAESLAGQVRDVQGNLLGGVGIHRDITARKVAEAALQESQRQVSMLADFLENSSQPFGVGYFDGRMGMFNEAYLHLLGYRKKELSKLNWEKDLTPPEWWEHEAAKLNELQRTGQPVRYEKEYRRKDGTRVPVEMFVHVRPDEHGHPLAYAFVTDITERKQAEAALQESEARFRTIFEGAAIGIGLADRNGRILALNPAFEKSLGYCLPDLSKKTFATITHAEDVQESQNLFEELMAGRRDHYHLEKRYICKDGSVMWGNLAVALVRDAAGAPKFAVGMIEDITARKEAEAALHRSKKEWERTFNTVSDLIFILDTEHHIIRANRATAEILGVAAQDLVGQTCHELLHRSPTPPPFCPHAQVLADGQEHSLEVHEFDRDFLVTVTPLVGDQGAIIGTVHVARDITEHKEAEAALEKERQRLFALLDELPGFIFLHGEDYSVRFTNRRCREIFGESHDRFCYTAFHHRSTPCEGCPASTVFETQTSVEWEQTIPDGRTFQIYKYPFRDVDGAPCVLSLGLDITDRKQAEEALRESEERFRQLAENINDAILLASGDWQRVHYISPAYERIWGRTCASLYEDPRSWLEGVAPEDQEEVKVALKKRMTGDFSEESFPQFRIRRPDGTLRWIAARFFPIRNEAGETYRIAGIATDITALKEMETVLQWRQEHLKQTAKMEAVGRLAGGVAHDFNNLLTIISGYGELLLTDLKDLDQGRQQVQAILKAAEQATAVTRQLLAFSRKQVLQPQIIDLNGVISSMVEMLSRLVDENIKISMRLAPDLGTVKADPSHMEQVIMNLFLNALDAMPQGGTLIITTENVEVIPEEARRHPEIPPGVYEMVVVADTGIGMTREVLSHIFEPFFTTKEGGQGTGLGLSMAYGIIKQSHGHIRVESRPGKGSIFRIYLPRAPKARKLEVPDKSTLAEGQDTGTILLVEDEEGVRHVVQRMLTLKGYTVLVANDGQEALQLSRDHPGPIHLLLTDVAMPVMGGRELAERLVPAHPEMKVLFMSGHTEDGIVRRGIQEAVINFLQKPFRADQLLSKINTLLANPRR